MTKEELSAYILSFKKRQGFYTKDEEYLIGLAYRDLSNKDKQTLSWKDLADIIGCSMKPETYRYYVFYRWKKSLLKNNGPYVTTDVEQTKLDVAKQHNKDVLNAIRRNNRDKARLLELKEFLAEEIEKLPELPKLKIPSYVHNNNRHGVLLLGDWHIGQDNDNFAGKYNFEIAKQRVEKLVTDTIRYAKLYKIDTLDILLLGDFFEGIINISARIEQEMDVCTQLIKSTELLCQALHRLQYAANVVTVRGVTDNHSRMAKDISLNITKENLYRIQEWVLTKRLEKTKLMFPNDNLDNFLGMFKLPCGKVVAFEHGHLLDRNTSLQSLLPIKKGTWIDIVCLAHKHSSYIHEYQGMKVYGNGCLCSGNPYANEHHLFSEASQKLLILDDKNTIDIDIGFDNFKK